MTDTERLEFIANSERTVATSKWLVQVIAKNGSIVSAYFDKPTTGTPDFVHETRLDALRYAIDKSMES